ncbi:MAG: response regulator transcription factor [Bacteroidales bacterium]|nr:response regulator transcription factor [Bacteroidales bacterium]
MQKTQTKILVVEDDKNAGYLLTENLKLSGYDVVLAKDGEEGIEQFEQAKFNLCILDIMLPKKDGHQLAREIRKGDADVPIIFLTARIMDSDKIEGFKHGCDDYVTKPYNIEELLWRIKAILKRTTIISPAEEKTEFDIGKYHFRYSERKLKIAKDSFNLSTKEADLLKILSRHQNKILSRSTIMNEVWGRDDYFVSKSLDVYLTKIRKYLKHDPDIEILNIHGHGYKMIVR